MAHADFPMKGQRTQVKQEPGMYPFRRTIFAVLLLASSLLGCSPVGSNLPPLDQGPVADASYKLGPGDQIKVTVFGADDLSGEFPVSDTGTAVLPLIGEVKAAGLTPRELETAIRSKLAAGYLKDPKVSIQIMNFRPIYVLGEVSKPGDHPYVPGMTVRSAIALAGGFTPRANQTFVVVTRKNQEFRASVSSTLRPDDVVQVSERFF
jgi:polysaccharide export outer membrane protein